MTVSYKRLIAFVALVAIALAGTPTNSMAKDGLNAARYGFGQKQQNIRVARQVPANLNQNPFREKTVIAKLSGAALQIDRATVTESNVAVLLMHQSERLPEAVADWSALNEGTVCHIQIPVFQNSPQASFHESWLGASRAVTGWANRLMDAAWTQTSIVQAAETEFYKSVTAAAAGFHAPISKYSPGTLSAASPKWGHATLWVVRPTNVLQRPSGPNIEIEIMEGANRESGNVRQDLLIEDYLPPSLAQDVIDSSAPTRPSAVPAMTIGYQKKLPVPYISPRSLIQSAKAIIKSIFQAWEPMKEMAASGETAGRVMPFLQQVDPWIWSPGDGKQLWESRSLWQ